jgi:hypothetical protein
MIGHYDVKNYAPFLSNDVIKLAAKPKQCMSIMFSFKLIRATRRLLLLIINLIIQCIIVSSCFC